MDNERPAGRAMCFRCRRPVVTCLCAQITPIATRTHFVLLTHPMEYRRDKVGTGRAAQLSITTSELRVGVDFTGDARLRALLADPSLDCRLLYPGDNAVNLSRARYVPERGRRLVLFVVDATWPCAKKVLRSSPNLARLPRVGFDVERRSEFAIKHQPHPECLSTIESLDRVLICLAASGYESWEPDDSERLLRPFRKMVEMQTRYASDPDVSSYRTSRPYTLPSERRPSLKHSRRGVFARD